MSETTMERSVLLTQDAERRQAHDLLAATAGRFEGLATLAASQPVGVPPELSRLLEKVVEAVADGGTVVIGSMPDELSTTLAAEQLGISRPTLMKMIRNGEIPAHKVGTHHRLKLADVLTAKRARLAKQHAAFDELRRLEEELERF